VLWYVVKNTTGVAGIVVPYWKRKGKERKRRGRTEGKSLVDSTGVLYSAVE
jgi:hypothetical protein